MNLSQKREAGKQPTQSREFWTVLKKHLAILSEHYRQPISELSVVAYAEDLSSLTSDQLDAACQRARQTSEFMPVSAAILKAHEELRATHRQEYLGVPLLEYPAITQEERDAALAYSEAFKKTLAPKEEKPTKKQITVRPSVLSIDEQKRVLKAKGWL
jgi:hypothetical protein